MNAVFENGIIHYYNFKILPVIINVGISPRWMMLFDPVLSCCQHLVCSPIVHVNLKVYFSSICIKIMRWCHTCMGFTMVCKPPWSWYPIYAYMQAHPCESTTNSSRGILKVGQSEGAASCHIHDRKSSNHASLMSESMAKYECVPSCIRIPLFHIQVDPPASGYPSIRLYGHICHSINQITITLSIIIIIILVPKFLWIPLLILLCWTLEHRQEEERPCWLQKRRVHWRVNSLLYK